MPAFDIELLKLVSIPVVAGLVGWSTNWVAIKMTFYPLRFVGIPPFLGWQGIIPGKAKKMAEIFVDDTMSKLGTLEEVFDTMEPERISSQVIATIRPRLHLYTDEIMRRRNAILWNNTPALVKEAIYARVRQEMPRRIESLVADIRGRVEELVDLKDMISRRLDGERRVINRLFLETGDAEFRFIIRSGLYFGFLFGLVQLAVWVLYPAWWVLPFFGLLVGYATNWIAINIIFRPLKPVRLGPWVLQGMFLKRQPEVAEVWTRIVTTEILTLPALVTAMLDGPRSSDSKSLIRRHIEPVVDEAVGAVRPMAQVAVGLEGYEEIRGAVGEKALEVSLEPFGDEGFNQGRGRIVAELMRERIAALPPEDFQGLLRPCFQEDELKLILLGAALGLAAGVCQLVFVFGGVG